MEQNKFKVGDRVKCVCRPVFNELNEVGTVIDKYAGLCLIEFDNFVGGHNGNFDTVRKGNQGHCVYQSNDALVIVTDLQKIIITTDGATTTAKLLDGKKTVKTAEAHCCPNDKFDFMTGAELAFNRLIGKEEKKEQPKPEIVKLYCVESFNNGYINVTKGKTYETTKDGHIIFDGNIEGFYNWKDSAFIRDGNLFPLVKRHAKVGEWVLVTKSDGDDCNEYKNGDILNVTKVDWQGDAHYKRGCYSNCIFAKEYLVLDGYKGDPEADKKAEELAKLEKQKAEIEAAIKALSD